MANDNILKFYPKLCKDTVGGFKRAFIMPYYKHAPHEIMIDGVKLTMFPATCVTRYEVTGSYNQQTETENGHTSMTQQVTFNMPRIYDLVNPLIFTNLPFRILIETNNDQLILFGTRNGLDASITNTSGTNKNEENGFNLTFEGKEENYGVFVDTFEDFFTICDESQSGYFNYTFNFDI